MTSNDYAAMAASILKGKPISPRTTGISRDRGIAIVAQAMEQSVRTRRRQRLWVGGAIALTAAAAAVALVVFRGSAREETTAKAELQCSPSAGGCAPLARSLANDVDVGHCEGRDIMPGGIIQADTDRTAQVHFDSGTRIALGGNTMLGYDEGADIHRFSLSRGAVHLEVAKLKRGQRFLVNTADTEVEVRGTVFDVSVIPASNGCETRTSVSVSEGFVEVRSANELRTLRGGEVWLPECVSTPSTRELSAAGAPSASSERSARVVPLESRSVPKDAEGTLAPSVEGRKPTSEPAVNAPVQSQADSVRASDLAKQNDIYARASAERNLGHAREALNLYRELISRFPSSALVESACVQRIRILRSTNPAAASGEAKQYLARFPKGFARVEAETLVP